MPKSWRLLEARFPRASAAAAVLASAALGFAGSVRAQSFTEFVLPTAGSFPIGIAAGQDGNLWFTEQYSNKIGRITPAGLLTEFDMPGSSGLLLGIAAGPDGNLWFTEYLANRIGQITPAGVITEFAIPTANSFPGGIAAGPDGNMWFTELNAVGRVTPAGVITQFPIPTAGNVVQGIAAGPDGALWFTEFPGKIGRLTPAGVITELTIPTSFPAGITAGPDGNVWFTDQHVGKIVRINLSATCASSAASLCLNNGRFRVEATWAAGDGTSGSGQGVALTPDAGYFWFFSPNNPEIVVKVLSDSSFGCVLNDHYWLFAAGLTDVHVVLTVTDTQTGRIKTYTNPQFTAFQPIQDTTAFDCP